MSQDNDAAASDAPWKGETAPCVYCGRPIPRDAKRCPECRTSYSLAVRKAYREVEGNWFYLDRRNPSGRGVTFEALVKLVEKGRLRPESIVRGPSTHQDWMYAAETPRLAKYLGICPHCFAETTPDQTYCTRCQLNMNERPARPRPGVPAGLVKEPFHKAAHEREKELARHAAASKEAKADVLAPARGPQAPTAPQPVGPAGAIGAALRMPSESKTRPTKPVRKRRPKVWVVLLLTWVTVVPLFLVSLFFPAPSGCETFNQYQDQWRATFGLEAGPATEGAPQDGPDKVLQEWMDGRLAAADRAIEAGDFEGAIAIYEQIIERTDEAQWQARIDDLHRMIEQRRNRRLEALRERLKEADELSRAEQYEDALAILRNADMESRRLITEGLNFDVAKMESRIRQEHAAHQQDQQARMARLTEKLDRASFLTAEQRLQEALQLYEEIARTFPRDLVDRQVDIDRKIADLKTEMASSGPPAEPPTPPEPPPQPALTEQEIIEKVADLMEQAVELEEAEDFAGALETLGAIKDFPPKYWPTSLDKRIEAVKKKKAALEFFGMDGDS